MILVAPSFIPKKENDNKNIRIFIFFVNKIIFNYNSHLVKEIKKNILKLKDDNDDDCHYKQND